MHLILFVQILHLASTEMVRVQPYGPLMCHRLAQTLTNKADPDNFDPVHLTCQVDVPDQILDMRMRCVMCTYIPGASFSQQVCQTVNSHIVCSLISNNRSCVFTDKFDDKDSVRKMVNWTDWRRVGPPCWKELQNRISRELLQSGETVVFYLCKTQYTTQTDKEEKTKERKKKTPGRDGVRYRRDIVECDVSLIKLTLRHRVSSEILELYVSGQDSINCFLPETHSTGVIAAAFLKKIKLFEQLVSLGADLSLREIKNASVLQVASMHFNIIRPVKYLVEIGLDIEDRCSQGLTPFLAAAVGGNVAVLDYLVSVGSNLKVVSNSGMNALHLAAYFGHLEMTEHLLTTYASFDINGQTPRGYTPMYFAMYKNHQTIVAKLNELIASGHKGK